MCLINGLLRVAATTTATTKRTSTTTSIAEPATSDVLSALRTMFLLLTMLATLTTTTLAATTMGTTITTKTTPIVRTTVNAQFQQQQQRYQHPNYHRHHQQQQQQQQQPLLNAKTLALVEGAIVEAAATRLQDAPHVDNSNTKEHDDDVRYASVSRKNNYIYNSYTNNYHGNNDNYQNKNYPNNNDRDVDDTVHSTVDGTQDPDASSSSAFSFSTPPPTPVFDFGMPRNITARSGQTAAINCRVEHLGDKSVSWIRKRDLHILTAGILTYTSDERFKVLRTDDSKDWSLHVRYAQPRDSGIYECQVNTEPKISMAFRLNVIVTPPDARAIISGPTDLYVKVGSAITLNCLVRQPSSRDIGPIHWYRGAYIITPFVVVHPNDAAIDLSRRISMESQLGDVLKSRLRLANAQTEDSGNYTCMPTTAEAASVMVHVINDENPAAMQKSAAAPTLTTVTITTGPTRWLQVLQGHRVAASFAPIICLMHAFQMIHNLLWRPAQATR